MAAQRMTLEPRKSFRFSGLAGAGRSLRLAAGLIVLAIPLSGCGTGALWDKFTAKDDTFNDATNTPLLFQKSYGLLGAALTWTEPDGRWSIGVGGDNLADEDYLISGFNQPGVGYTIATWGAPRQWWSKLQFHL